MPSPGASMRTLLVGLWFALVVGAVTARAHAEDAAPDDRRARARELADQGDAAFSIGRCDRAIPLWRQAEQAFHAPTILLRIARCEALLGKVVDATATLESITAEKPGPDAPQPFVEAFATAQHDLPSVRSRIATLMVEVRAAAPVAASVEIDDRPVSATQSAHRVDPGPHRVRVRARDTVWEQTLELEDAETKHLEVLLTLETPQHKVSAQRWLGYGLGGLGLVAMAIGGAFGYAALQTSNSLSDVCGADRKHCPPDRQGDLDKLQTDALVADVTLGAGAALFVAGGVLLLTEPRREQPRVKLAPSGLGARAIVEF